MESTCACPNSADGHDRGDGGGHDVGDPGPGRRNDHDLRRQFTVVCTFVSPFIPILGVALHRPRPAGAGHTTSLARCRGHASAAQAARSGSPRLKNEWVRPCRVCVPDPGHSLLTRERRSARDGGSGALMWPSAGGRHPTFIAVNGPGTPAPAGVKPRRVGRAVSSVGLGGYPLLGRCRTWMLQASGKPEQSR
jgi:hypothetical protein